MHTYNISNLAPEAQRYVPTGTGRYIRTVHALLYLHTPQREPSLLIIIHHHLLEAYRYQKICRL